MSLTIQFLEVIEIILKLLIAIMCGGLLAFERLQPIKRYFSKILVSISFATCLLVLIWERLGFTTEIALPVVFISSIIIAVGLFTSGIIIIHHGSAESIVLSAFIWIAAGIGMAIGFSLYHTAIIATILGYVILYLLDKTILGE